MRGAQLDPREMFDWAWSDFHDLRSARQETRDRLDGAFDLRAFHTHALALGPIGLDQLRTELASFAG